MPPLFDITFIPKEMRAKFYGLLADVDKMRNLEQWEGWIRSATQFLSLPNLDAAHWRKIRMRDELIPILLNPEFSQEAIKQIEAQIEAHALIAPPLHHEKLPLFNAYKELVGKNYKAKLAALDPNFEQIFAMYN